MFVGHVDPLVLGLAGGGVAVAAEVAHALGAPLDVIVIGKVGVPGDPDLAMGVIGEGGTRVLNDEVIALAGIDHIALEAAEETERAKLDLRVARLRMHRPRATVAGRTLVIVDDGLATSATALDACMVARAQGAARIIMAAPIGTADAIARVEQAANTVICPHIPAWFTGLGSYYEDFRPVTDDEIIRLLRRSGGLSAGSLAPS
jgi:putative phosphoribosyl transferase